MTMDDLGAIIGGTLGLSSVGAVTSVGSVSVDETLGQLGSGGLSEWFDTSSVTSKEVTPHTAEGLTTAPSQAGGFAAGATVVVGASGIGASVAPTTSPMESCSGVGGSPLPGGGRVWEDSSGNIHIDSNTIPYSRVEYRAQQTYDPVAWKAFNAV